jgi:hypothetical protein
MALTCGNGEPAAWRGAVRRTSASFRQAWRDAVLHTCIPSRRAIMSPTQHLRLPTNLPIRHHARTAHHHSAPPRDPPGAAGEASGQVGSTVDTDATGSRTRARADSSAAPRPAKHRSTSAPRASAMDTGRQCGWCAGSRIAERMPSTGSEPSRSRRPIRRSWSKCRALLEAAARGLALPTFSVKRPSVHGESIPLTEAALRIRVGPWGHDELRRRAGRADRQWRARHAGAGDGRCSAGRVSPHVKATGPRSRAPCARELRDTYNPQCWPNVQCFSHITPCPGSPCVATSWKRGEAAPCASRGHATPTEPTPTQATWCDADTAWRIAPTGASARRS